MGSGPIAKLWFVEAKIKKSSFFILPTICTMVNLANFTYFGKLDTNTQDVVTRPHIFVKGFKSKGGNTHVITFDFILILNMPY